MKIARYEKRLIGWAIDCILPVLMGSGLTVLIFVYGGLDLGIYFPYFAGGTAFYIFYVLINGFWMFFGKGQTIGMCITGIRTIYSDQGKVGLADSLIKAMITGHFIMNLVNAIYMVLKHTEISPIDRITQTVVVAR